MYGLSNLAEYLSPYPSVCKKRANSLSCPLYGYQDRLTNCQNIILHELLKLCTKALSQSQQKTIWTCYVMMQCNVMNWVKWSYGILHLEFWMLASDK